LSAEDTTSLESHFGFGENWRSFAETLSDSKIAEAERGLSKLLSVDQIRDRSFLDIGCGSGLSMLAALRLGAKRVVGYDLDPNSVLAARSVLERFAPDGSWQVAEKSALDLDPTAEQFDIVHSWGVLHHTGNMWDAVDKAAKMVMPGGLLVLALYRRTPFCGLWRIEKRIYTRAPRWLQWIIRSVYKAALIASFIGRRQNPWRYIADYERVRGMNWHHDVHDWLGGYPYDSVLPSDVAAHIPSGFAMERVFENAAGTIGLFGTGCDEFILRRT
jgi:2-polyprenyl-6-hydroxyphenyl methylase/3-demethylubiquinone-9 3-methyltransferase